MPIVLSRRDAAPRWRAIRLLEAAEVPEDEPQPGSGRVEGSRRAPTLRAAGFVVQSRGLREPFHGAPEVTSPQVRLAETIRADRHLASVAVLMGDGERPLAGLDGPPVLSDHPEA